MENEAMDTKEAGGRFSKKKFNSFLKTILNDTEFAAKVAVVKDKELKEVKDVMVTKDFRKFLKRVIEKAGIDAAESEIVMSDDFTIDNVDGLYEFISEAVYAYMESGNGKFQFLPKEDFRGEIILKEKAEEISEREVRNPKDGSKLGKYQYHTKRHKVITASCPVPDYLRTRKRV